MWLNDSLVACGSGSVGGDWPVANHQAPKLIVLAAFDRGEYGELSPAFPPRHGSTFHRSAVSTAAASHSTGRPMTRFLTMGLT